MKEYSRHFEQRVAINAKPDEVFVFADDYNNFSSHMNQSSLMMGGGSMITESDEGNGQRIGSHIKMSGKVFGINLYLDEVIIEYEPPKKKTWETVGSVNLIVIDKYKLGFEIDQDGGATNLKVSIDYNLPTSRKTKLLGKLFGGIYAKWCVEQMTDGVSNQFNNK